LINDTLGQVYNQLGVIEEGLSAVDWYLRGVRWGFEGAKSNLERVWKVKWRLGEEWDGNWGDAGELEDRVRGRVCVGVMQVFKELKTPREELVRICKSILDRFLLKIDGSTYY
jgi:hypothetical protein